MKSGEGGPVLNKNIPAEEVSFEKSSESAEASGIEHSPLSSFDFAEPGKKIEFVTREVRDEIITDLHVIELKAGVGSQEMNEAEAAGQKLQDGIEKAAEEFGVSEFLAAEPYEIKPAETVEPRIAVTPQNSTEAPTVAEEIEGVQTESLQKPQKTEPIGYDAFSESDVVFEKPAPLFKRISKHLSSRLEEKVDPVKARFAGSRVKAHAEKVSKLHTSHVAYDKQIRDIDEKLSFYERHRKDSNSVTEQKRIDKKVAAHLKRKNDLLKKQTGIAERKKEHQDQMSGFETKRHEIIGRMNARFDSILEPYRLQEKESEVLIKKLETTIIDYEARLKTVRKELDAIKHNREFRKVLKEKAKTFEAELKAGKTHVASFKDKLAAGKKKLAEVKVAIGQWEKRKKEAQKIGA